MRPDRFAAAALHRRKPAFIDHRPAREDFLKAVLEGLSAPQKSLPCRFLYDAEGSALFDAICGLPEYYPTRTETGILRDNAQAIARHLGPFCQLVELGSGSSAKVGLLLDALEAPWAYVPIDISAAHLAGAAARIQARYPELSVQAVCADYAQDFALPPKGAGRRAGFYPGSTIGNLHPREARLFLKRWAARLGPGAAMIVGVDLRKDPVILEPAYDDAKGVTAAFTLNILRRVNRELGGDFDLTQFRHEARYLEGEGRVVIHLRALSGQSVTVAGNSFRFAAGERLHVEDSWKYSVEDFQRLAVAAGFAPLDCFLDEGGLFSVHLLEVPDSGSA